MLIMTMDAIPGYDITVVLGPVAATTWGQPVPRRTSVESIDELRNASIAQILQQAQHRGANAIVGVRFETVFASGDMPYVIASGTAVRSTPVSAEARQQYDAMVREGRVPPLP